MPDIKIKRYADKENLKKLMKYSKDTFANKSEINEKFYTKEQIDTMLESGSGGGGGTGGDYYTKSEIDTKLDSKANKTTTLSGYGITDAYTKSEIDIKLSSKANTSDLLSNYYTKKQIDIMLSRVGSDKYGESIIAEEAEGSDDTQGRLSFYTAVERAPGYDGTSQMNISEDYNTVEDE